MRVKTAEKTAESLRETGVAWMGLLRKLYEKSEVRVLEYLPYVRVVKWPKTRACKALCLNWREFESHLSLHMSP